MEISTEIERETTQEETCEIRHDDFHLETPPTRGNQMEMHFPENNMAVEQSEYEQEVVVNKLNLKQQIDIQKLIREECKQYINIEEQKKILESAMNQQKTKVQNFIQLLKTKINDEKSKQRTARIESHNENRKLVKIKIFTESTKEFVDVLRSYVEGFEQQMDKLKYTPLQQKVLKKYENSLHMINERTSTIEKIQSEIRNVNSEFIITGEKLKSDFVTTQNNMRSQEECLKIKFDSLLQGNQELAEEISKIDQDLDNKQKEEFKSSAKMKEIFNSKINQLENWKKTISKIQKLELQGNDLLKSIEGFSSSIDTLTGDVEKLEREKITIEVKLQTLQQDTANIPAEDNIEEKEISDMDREKQYLSEELRKIEEHFLQSKKFHDEIIKVGHENEMKLLKRQNVSTSLAQELLSYKNLNNENCKGNQNLKAELQEKEKEVGRKLETVEEKIVSLDSNKQRLQNNLEKLQQEIRDRNDQLNYQRNTLQIHLESKLKDLEKKLDEIEKRNKEAKEKFTEMETINKKNNERYTRLRHVYLMLKTSTSTKFKSPYSHRTQLTGDNPRENIETEKIEAEHPTDETSPKSILKSPGKTRATKNVQFVGVPSIESSNSTEMGNTNTVEVPDPFDEIKSNLVVRQRRRTFD